MMYRNTNRISCADCGTLALAYLGDVPYCSRCLLAGIGSGEDGLKRCIRPLNNWAVSTNWADSWPQLYETDYFDDDFGYADDSRSSYSHDINAYQDAS